MTTPAGGAGPAAPGPHAVPDPAPAPGPDLRLLPPAVVTWVAMVLLTVRPARQAALVAIAAAVVASVLALAAWRSGASCRGERSAAARPPGGGKAAGHPCGRMVRVAAATLACLAGGAAVTALHTRTLTTGPLPRLARAGATVTVEAALAGDPHMRPASVSGSQLLDPLTVVRVRVTRLRAPDGTTVRLRQPVLVLGSGDGWEGLLPSQPVTLTGRLSTAGAGEGVAALLRVRAPPQLRGRPSLPQRVAGGLRAGLRDRSAALGGAEAGLLPGLVVGDTSRLSPEVRSDFTAAGLSHLTAVSGSNVAIVLAAALGVARRGRLGPRAAPLAAALALLGFVVLARPDPSVLRAAVMGLIALAGLASGRPRSAVPALGATTLVLLLAVPDLARAPGFALSVVATAGLLLVAPGWAERMAARWPRPVATAVAIPLAAQAVCGPLLALFFGQVSLVSVPANLLAAPAVPVATVAGVCTALAAPVCPWLADLCARVAEVPCWWLVTVAERAARAPAAVLAWPDGLTGALTVVALTALAVGLLSRRRARRLTAAAAAGAVFGGLVIVPAAVNAWPPRDWAMVVCDVGQGDAIVLRGDALGDILLDAGPDPARLRACLQTLGVHRIRAVILSHIHADHNEGLPAVLGRMPVGEVLAGPLPEPAGEWARVNAWARAAGVPVSVPRVGDTGTAGPVSWTVIGPEVVLHGTGSDTNNNSLVLRVETHGVSLLLTGDVETTAQQMLLGAGRDVRADVVKVPHHGSERQDARLLPAVGARFALTSVGAGNPYGHPSPVTMQRARDAGAVVLRTDADGGLAVSRRDGVVRVEPQHRHVTVTPGARSRALPAAAWCGPPPVTPPPETAVSEPVRALTACRASPPALPERRWLDVRAV